MLGMQLPVVLIVLCGPLLAYTLLPHINSVGAFAESIDPGFVFPFIMALLGVVFAVATQLRINANPRVICASPAYLQWHGRPAYLADLDEHQCIILHGSALVAVHDRWRTSASPYEWTR